MPERPFDWRRDDPMLGGVVKCTGCGVVAVVGTDFAFHDGRVEVGGETFARNGWCPGGEWRLAR